MLSHLFFNLILPFVFLMTCLMFMARPIWNRSCVYGLVLFFLSFVLGLAWYINEIFVVKNYPVALRFHHLPNIASIVGVMGLVTGRLHTSYLIQKKNNWPTLRYKVRLIVCSLLILLFFAWQLNELNMI